MPAITSANVANAIVKLVAADALPALVGNLVMGNLVNRDYEPILAQAGDTVNIPIAPTLTANNLLEGGTVQTQNPNIGNAQIVLNTHCEATFLIPDVTKVPERFKTVEQGAATTIWAAVSRQLNGKGGVYCEDCDIAAMVPADSKLLSGVRPWAVDEAAAEALWVLSEKLTALSAGAIA